MGYALHSFCKKCGAHRRQMPFGDYSTFFDRDPCYNCGHDQTGRQVVSQKVKLGRWWWSPSKWIDTDGNRVDIKED